MVSSQFLWYLIQIEKYQSFSLTAEKIHITQPSLSIAIKKLEEQLGLELVNRQYHKTELTEDGKKIVELAKKAFSYFDEIENFSLRRKQSQLLSLEDITLFCAPFLFNLLTSVSIDLFDQYKSSLRISNINSKTDISSLLAEQPNTIVVAVLSEKTEPPQNCQMITLQTSKSYIICSKNSSYFPAKQTSVSFKELLKVPLILAENANELQHILLEHLKKYGDPTIKTIAPDVSSMSSMINKNLGVSFASKLSLEEDTDLSTTRYLLIRNAPKFHLCLFYKNDISEEKITILQKLLQKHMR